MPLNHDSCQPKVNSKLAFKDNSIRPRANSASQLTLALSDSFSHLSASIESVSSISGGGSPSFLSSDCSSLFSRASAPLGLEGGSREGKERERRRQSANGSREEGGYSPICSDADSLFDDNGSGSEADDEGMLGRRICDRSKKPPVGKGFGARNPVQPDMKSSEVFPLGRLARQAALKKNDDPLHSLYVPVGSPPGAHRR